MPEDLVLVTGGSGFVAIHCIVALLNAGYRVRTTVRTLDRKGEVLDMLQRAGLGDAPVDFVAANLMSDEGWATAVAGCRYVLHVASPFHLNRVKHEDELVVPAREGTLRVLRASRDAGVERVVLTSSFAAIGYGHAATRTEPYTEQDWTNINGDDVSPYIKSKAVAERAAWDFLEREGGSLQLASVNPPAIFGPALGPKLSGSVEVMQKMLNGEIPACPRIALGVVDVRDVADLHVLAMTHPEANGQRFLAISGPALQFIELSRMLQAHLGHAGRRLPRRAMPDWVIRLVVLFRDDLRETVPLLGKARDASNEKARTLLGWQPRSIQEALDSCADSIIALGLVKP
jgi:dihydroflavonol-4-reductase